MSEEVERIQQYIEQTHNKENLSRYYDMNLQELIEILKAVGAQDGIYLAFQYGRAKGYRACMREVKKNGK